MYLLIDVGNTRIKWLVVDGAYNDTQSASYGNFDEFLQFINSLKSCNVQILLAAVNQGNELIKALKEAGFNQITVAVTKSEQLGVHNSYQQPERMGIDRWLAMVAAYTIEKEKGRSKGLIIVDAGSALTVDVVNQEGHHLGGYIVPGLMMAQQMLFQNTERVIQYDESQENRHIKGQFNNLGNNTLQCVEYGVINQLTALVQSVANRYSDYEIIFTGGDSEMLANFFTAGRVDKNLVLKGLWQVRN